MSILDLIRLGASRAMNEQEFLSQEIRQWQYSEKRRLQVTGKKYYEGEHDILSYVPQMVDANGNLQEVKHIPNNRIVDNRYEKAVDQKVNFSFSKPFTIETESEDFLIDLETRLDNRMRQKISRWAKVAINQGIAWLHPYYDEMGELRYKVFNGYEILPFWSDEEHTILESAIRLYTVEGYDGRTPITIDKVEYYTKDGIQRYLWLNDELVEDVENPSSSYIVAETAEGVIPMNWENIPLIPLKFNDSEKPLIKRVKTLQDGINKMISNALNASEENPRNSVLILENYEGTDLGEFRYNLMTYGMIKVGSYEGTRGDVRTLNVEFKPEQFETVLKQLRRALTANARAVDIEDDRFGANPNEMNIKALYDDMQLDADDFELQFKAAFEELLMFIVADIVNKGGTDYSEEPIDIIFNRNMMINESSVIDDCKNSLGIISEETIVSRHPWTKNKTDELERIEAERGELIQDPLSG